MVIAALLVVLAGFLVGGVISFWPRSRVLACGIGACAVLSLAAGVLRMVS